ncbi:MAG: flippase-like domain-containing protein, partial [Nitrososphaerota archaeon]|nr:flippase-like domain-containing protein [Nitrososphaerota archaeon]
MEMPQTKFTWKTVVFPFIGIAAFLIYIYFFHVDIPAIVTTLKTINPLPYIVAVIFSLLEVLFFSLSWRVLANFLRIKLSVIRSHLLVWYGIFVDTLIPAEAVSGELVRAYYITKEQGNSKCGPALASLVTQRFLGMGINIAILLIG